MPNNDDYLRLRRMSGETDSDSYTNTDLDTYLERAGGDMAGAASLIWGEKASDYADLVNQSEAGSSRSNSDLFKHAVEQRDYFNGIAVTPVIPTGTEASTSTTRRIVRA